MNRAEVIGALVLAGHTLTRIAAQEAKDETPAAQWRVLSILSREGALRVGALAQAARTTQPGMTRLLGDMEREELIRRSPDPADSRAIVVTITDGGNAAIEEWRDRLRTILVPRFADITESDWDALATAAEILISHSFLSATTSTGASE